MFERLTEESSVPVSEEAVIVAETAAPVDAGATVAVAVPAAAAVGDSLIGSGSGSEGSVAVVMSDGVAPEGDLSVVVRPQDGDRQQ